MCLLERKNNFKSCINRFPIPIINFTMYLNDIIIVGAEQCVATKINTTHIRKKCV